MVHQMLRIVAAPSVLLVLLVSDATAFKEPEPKAFRDVPTRDIDFCYAIPPEHRMLGDRACTGPVIFGDSSVQAIYSFRADHFVSVAVNYSSKDFDRIVTVFIERYGAPTSEERPPFKSLDGFNTTNQILRWDGPVIAIVLRRYAVETTEGLGSIMTQDEVREARRIFSEQTKGGARGR